ncbi:M15 family metallopeptidase [Paenibacillus nasutitermitis]|uniref:Carboxypeptidase YodJ n=1 Tax=Paenibacillus nasutitermitis TaxID=1652958 RepID=A0A916ZF87_9BACL|nr:M15 family metallopeptidase [Paenibacillus nasutitermitis]GGD94315.1 putative carboxypeptidase YodJ [Paenibacillus nasutitermitis]
MKADKKVLSFILLGSMGAALVFSTAFHSKSFASGQTAVSQSETGAKIAAAASSTNAYGGQKTFTGYMHLNAPSLTIKKNSSGLKVVTNPTSPVVLVNKYRNLPASYVPGDLTIPKVAFSFSGDNPKKQMRKTAASALEKLFAGAKEDGITLKAVSGYRSYATQKAIFDRNKKLKGEKEANKTSARPGQSEHQTGLTMDVSSASVGYSLEQSFGDTKEGKWLRSHAAEYGFIIRYPKGAEKLTEYSYEPWHVRYVGVYIASEITKADMTLEQYMKLF